MEILNVYWVNCFQKKDRQMRCSNNIEWLHIAFFVEFFQLLLLGLLFSENKKCIPCLRPKECPRAQRPNAQTGIPLTYKFLLPPVPGDIMLTISTVAFFSSFVCLGSACKEVLSTPDLRYSWVAWWAIGKCGLPANRFLFLRLFFTLNW